MTAEAAFRFASLALLVPLVAAAIVEVVVFACTNERRPSIRRLGVVFVAAAFAWWWHLGHLPADAGPRAWLILAG